MIRAGNSSDSTILGEGRGKGEASVMAGTSSLALWRTLTL